MLIQDFSRHLAELLSARNPFAVATVVATHGSSAAKPGAKALIIPPGRNVWGWVGGGCAERYVINEAMNALAAREPRRITVDLRDEVFGAGMPCGGHMEVYIEPVFPPRRLWLVGHHPGADALSRLAADAGLETRATGHAPFSPENPDAVLRLDSSEGGTNRPAPGCPDEFVWQPGPVEARLNRTEWAVSVLASLLSGLRNKSGASLRQVKAMPNGNAAPVPWGDSTPELLLVGHNPITRELARLGVMARWPVGVCASNARVEDYPRKTRLFGPESAFRLPPSSAATCAVVATQHKDDQATLTQLLAGPAPYIGLIASTSRARLILKSLGTPQAVPPTLYAPAGLDLGAATPFEIALSTVAEIILCRFASGTSGSPQGHCGRLERANQ